ncbi:MAG: CapA family protein [Anaerolineales bacterium]|nr:CapA family protein [Anaerolineales bacterium]
MKKKFPFLLNGLFAGFIFLLAACQQAQPPSSTPTKAPVGITPTATSIQVEATPTATPEPTLPPSETPAPTSTPTPTPIPRTTLLFTGVIVPARCVQAAIDEYQDSDYLYDEVRGLIQGADLAIGTLNATISDYPPRTGCLPTYVLVGGSENADALERAGFDLMSVATNHIKNCGLSNCGDRAFIDTIDNLERVGIVPIGAGANLGQAMQPKVVEINGVRFGFVSLGQLEPIAFAAEDRPGIAVLTEENLRSAILAAKEVSDVVIVMPHWGPEDVPVPNWSQRDLAQVAVESGADLVVGNHTHVVQAIQQIDGVQVFYGLGNFVFDQNWDLHHQQGVILVATIEGTELVDYQLIPTHVDFDGRVHIADELEAAQILERIADVSRSLQD